MTHVDTIEAGEGPTVALVHSSVAGAGQWRALIEAARGAHRLIAPNLFGYGATSPWDGLRPQTLGDQAELAISVLPDGPVSLVGHSFGGSVAMEAARRLGPRAERLVLIEPNPFFLLRLAGRHEAHAEAEALRLCIVEAGRTGDWAAAAAAFADYWTGPGSWAAMPEARRARFAEALRPNLHEWDAAVSEATTLDTWREALPRATTVVWARDTVRTIREIVALMRAACPGWRYVPLETGGHMAPLTRPDRVNALILEALSAPAP